MASRCFLRPLFREMPQPSLRPARVVFSRTQRTEEIITRAFSALSITSTKASQTRSYSIRGARSRLPYKTFALPNKFIGVSALKLKQKERLDKLQELAQRELWQHLQQHTDHKDSAFDWMMFPINLPSHAQGERYMVDAQDVETLRQDKEFMDNYRKGIILVAKSWGWDLENLIDCTDEKKHWTKYDVRLGKMLHSLKLFKQNDLYRNLIHFIREHQLTNELESWILPYLI